MMTITRKTPEPRNGPTRSACLSKAARTGATAVVAIMLTACGGGGDGGDPTAVSPSPRPPSTPAPDPTQPPSAPAPAPSTPAPAAPAPGMAGKGGQLVKSVAIHEFGGQVIRENGELWGWGSNTFCPLGNGTRDPATRPVLLGTGWDRFLADDDDSSYALKGNDLYVWGRGPGLGQTHSQPVCTPTRLLSGVVSVAAEKPCASAVMNDGSIFRWGYSISGSDRQLTPVRYLAPSWRAVADKCSVMALVRSDGALFTLGYEASNTVLYGADVPRYQNISDPNYPTYGKPVSFRVGTASDWTAVFSGPSQFFATNSSGELWGWGRNGTLGAHRGELGVGDEIDRSTPVRILGPGAAIVRFEHRPGPAKPSFHVLRADGTVWVWGNNDRRLLGDGTSADAVTPELVANDVKDLGVSGTIAAWIRGNGDLWVWGQQSSSNSLNCAGCATQQSTKPYDPQVSDAFPTTP